MAKAERFAQDARRLADSIGAVNEGAAKDFLEEYPIGFIFELISAGEGGQTLQDAAVAALEKVLATPHGTAILPSVVQYAMAALGSPSGGVRKLGCGQLRRLCSVGSTAGGASGASVLVGSGAVQPLVSMLSDEDASVVAEAVKALEKLGASEEGRDALLDPASGGASLKALACGPSLVVQARVVALVAAIAGTSAAAAAAVDAAGLVEPLERQLSDTSDVLVTMAALESLVDLLSAHGVAALLLPRLAPRLEHLLAGEGVDPLLRSHAFTAAARLLAVPVESPAQAAQAGVQGLLGALRGVATQAVEVPDAVEERLLDALGSVGEGLYGAELLASGGLLPPLAEAALGGRVLGSRRISALHSLATVAGAERGDRGAAALGPSGEAALREAIYGAAAGAHGSPTVAEAVWLVMQQPFLEARVAVYRLVLALGMRVWGATEVCAHAAMLAHLTSPASETDRQGAEWRHAATAALAFTAASAANSGGGAGGDEGSATLLAAVAKLQAAARAGPYGVEAGGKTEAIPLYATMNR